MIAEGNKESERSIEVLKDSQLNLRAQPVSKVAEPTSTLSTTLAPNAAVSTEPKTPPPNSAVATIAHTPEDKSERQLSALCTLAVVSIPSGAEIFVDDDFVGNTPSTLSVSPGKHAITIKKTGFQRWVRKVNLNGGSITLNAELVSGSDETPAANPPVVLDSGNESAEVPRTNVSPNVAGWIGIHAQNRGDLAVVTDVISDGPAAKAGIQVGNIIVALDGRLTKGKDVEAAIEALKSGTQISINYARGPLAHTVWVTVSSKK